MLGKRFGILISLLASCASFAGERVFQPQLKEDASTGVKFSIPYTAGVHKGTASEIQGTVVIDENDNLSRAHFEVPIGSLSTSNATRDCHMREALGLDYSRSRFPAEHICDGDNKLPGDGPDSIAFPLIVLDFVNFQKTPATPFAEGAVAEASLRAKFEIHGKVFDVQELPVKIQKISKDGKVSFKVVAKTILSLKDFDIRVKPVKVGPIEIGVSDKATIDLDLLLSEKAP